jgi:hypothetical protein
MNKNISISIVVAGMLFFTGCGSNNSNTKDETQNGTSLDLVVQNTQNLSTFSDDNETNNSIPVSHCKKYTILKDENVTSELNATDADGDTLTYEIIKDPKHGRVEEFNSTTGKFIYIPESNYVGCDYFKFKASDSKSESNNSKIVIKIKEETIQKPDAPSSLNAIDIESTKVKLTWDDNSDNETKFIIYQDGKKVAEATADATYIVIENLDAQKDYEFCIKAKNEAGCSRGDKITVSTPSESVAPLAPSDLEVIKKNSSCVRLKWKDNSENEDGFKVYDENENEIKDLPKNSNCATIKDLNSNSTYKFSVKSYNSVAESNVSTNQVVVTTDEIEVTNSIPVAYNKTFCTRKETPLSKKLPACDKDHDSLIFKLEEDAKHGKVDFNATSNMFKYTPENEFIGCDSFKYSVSDDKNSTSDIKTITIKVK